MPTAAAAAKACVFCQIVAGVIPAQIVLDAKIVQLGGAGGEPVIKGASFLTLFATHVHTAAGPGSPTTPPMPQGESTTLSTTVLTK